MLFKFASLVPFLAISAIAANISARAPKDNSQLTCGEGTADDFNTGFNDANNDAFNDGFQYATTSGRVPDVFNGAFNDGVVAAQTGSGFMSPAPYMIPIDAMDAPSRTATTCNDMYNMGYASGYTAARQDEGYNAALQAAYRQGFNAGYATVEGAPPAPSGGFQRRMRERRAVHKILADHQEVW